jgi:ADP-heptose:LPS heptosyltransferase
MRFPDICVDHEYHLGDTILLEAIAAALTQDHENVYVSSDYPEIFECHPTIIGVQRDEELPEDTRIIDMSPAIQGIIDQTIVRNKLESMCKAAGLEKRRLASPKIYLSDSELAITEQVKEQFPGRCMGIAVETSMPLKNWPRMEKFVRQQTREEQHVCLFCKDLSENMGRLCKYAVIPFYDQPLREKMAHIAAMDIMVGPDTGLMHMAAALGVPVIVIGFDWFSELYDLYDKCDYINVPMYRDGMKTCSPGLLRRRIRKMGRRSPERPTAPAIRRKLVRSEIAIFRLDGMGGTLTVADQAKKIYEATGVKPDLIIRGYGDLFRKNPYVNDIVEVGHVKWGECLDEILAKYDTVAEIRFAPAKWHQRGKQWFHQDFGPVQELFDDFPMFYNELEVHEKHQVQLTDWYLGLPEDTIDMELFDVKAFDGLPDTYLVINNGVDVIHKGMRQTKVWNRWDELVKIVPIPTVQTGTLNDPLIPGVIDIRGKYKLNQLPYIIQKATVGAFTEGGLMHLSYAAGHPNIFILRGPTRGKLFEYPGQHIIDSYICYNCWYSTEDWFERCPEGIDAVCMKSITPERVAMNLQEVIG